MILLKIIYARFKHIPLFTQDVEYDFKRFIIKKHDKTDYHKDKEFIKNINYIDKYGTIIDPVEVSICDFSKKLIVRNNIMGYYALKEKHFRNIPIRIAQ